MRMPLAQRVRTAAAVAKAFLAAGLWQLDLDALPRWKALLVRLARALMVAVAKFFKDQCMLRACALTFYTPLSIVPVFAVIFGIAKGFGLERLLEKELMEHLTEALPRSHFSSSGCRPAGPMKGLSGTKPGRRPIRKRPGIWRTPSGRSTAPPRNLRPTAR